LAQPFASVFIHRSIGLADWPKGEVELTGRDQILLDQEMVVARLNRVLMGWANHR
jgi:hypothetical protein